MKPYPIFFLLLFTATFATDSVAKMTIIYPNLHGLGEKLSGYSILKLALENSKKEFDLQLTRETVNDSRARAMLAA